MTARHQYDSGRDRFFWLWWVFCLIVGIAFWAGLFYIALHFLVKVW